MSRENRDKISKILGVEPILIDSKLLTAQGRRRLYWTNITNLTQPEDKGIKLKHIISPNDDFVVDWDWEPISEGRFAGAFKKKMFESNRKIANLDYHIPCLDTQCSKYYLHNGKVYRVSPLECERLQGLPDGYTEGISKTSRYKALGNAYTAPVIAHILKHIVKDE